MLDRRGGIMQFNKFIVREPVAISRWEARMALRDRVKPAVWVGFLFIILMQIPGNLILAFSGYTDYMLNPMEVIKDFSVVENAPTAPIETLLLSLGGGMIFFMLVTGPFSLSQALFFLRYRRRQVAETGLIFYGFNYFGKALATYLLIALFVLMWSMIIYIPGAGLGILLIANSYSTGFPFPGANAGLVFGVLIIVLALIGAIVMMTIKLLQYQLAYFLLADHPGMKPLEAIETSKYLMKGNRAKLFLLNLSFLGWYILASCVGSFALMPFSFIISMGNMGSNFGAQTFYMIINALVSGVTMGFLSFYRGTANAAFYEKVRGLAPGGMIPLADQQGQ